MNTNISFSLFYDKTLKLLDEMAPFKKLTKKEINLQQKPWISKGILNSMKKRDTFYKDFIKEKNPVNKERLHRIYKSYRNLIVTLLRKSKIKYYTEYFAKHNNNIKKTWDGIRELINLSKKSPINISKLIEGDQSITDTPGITNTMNNFFCKYRFLRGKQNS